MPPKGLAKNSQAKGSNSDVTLENAFCTDGVDLSGKRTEAVGIFYNGISLTAFFAV